MTPNTKPTRDDIGALVAAVLALIALMGCAALAMHPHPSEIDSMLDATEAAR